MCVAITRSSTQVMITFISFKTRNGNANEFILLRTSMSQFFANKVICSRCGNEKKNLKRKHFVFSFRIVYLPVTFKNWTHNVCRISFQKIFCIVYWTYILSQYGNARYKLIRKHLVLFILHFVFPGPCSLDWAWSLSRTWTFCLALNMQQNS